MISEEFIEDRIDEVSKDFQDKLKGVMESAAFEAGVADPTEIVDEIAWWVELSLAPDLKEALLGGARNA